MKWGLLDTLKIHSFRFNQPYDELKPDRFLLDLFNNPNVRYMLPDVLSINNSASLPKRKYSSS